MLEPQVEQLFFPEQQVAKVPLFTLSPKSQFCYQVLPKSCSIEQEQPIWQVDSKRAITPFVVEWLA